MKKLLFYALIPVSLVSCHDDNDSMINRESVVSRNNPVVTAVDTLASLSLGNGGFAYTVDVTGLQTFPQVYKNGIPLGTQSQWGWHSFSNPEHYKAEDVWKAYDFGRGHEELYACQFEAKQETTGDSKLYGTVHINKFEGTARQHNASEWLRINPHRLHLGIVGLELEDSLISHIEGVNQKLDLWNGEIVSRFSLDGNSYRVQTVCHPSVDEIAASVSSSVSAGIKLRFPYPSGGHTDDACDWNSNEKHTTTLVEQNGNSALLKRTVDSTTYYVNLCWEGMATLKEKEKNYFVLTPADTAFSFVCRFAPQPISTTDTFDGVKSLSKNHWNSYWQEGGIVDFSECTDPRAGELERRVVLSQYLLAIQCAGNTPPQETGLTYNSWYGKFHMEMIWWHQAQFALWGHPELLERTLGWYKTVEPQARAIARRQGFDGVRWMKMTDPNGGEAPSNIGSFLIWQQPHIIYLAELLYRANPSEEIIKEFNELVQETAKFMYSFAVYDKEHDRYILKGAIPAQETLEVETTVNPPFELSYWHFAMQTAQKWRERAGMERVAEWDLLCEKLSKLAYNEDHLYLAAETALDTYTDIRFSSDHMAVLGSVGILPMNELINPDYMKNTLNWVWNNWNWDKTWGWDYPMTAMNAARLNDPEKAVDALLMDKRTNTYLISGHNYQDERLRIYLPGNGGLLTTVAMMCAGWDGSEGINPGFPKNGKWNVRWEGLKPLP